MMAVVHDAVEWLGGRAMNHGHHRNFCLSLSQSSMSTSKKSVRCHKLCYPTAHCSNKEQDGVIIATMSMALTQDFLWIEEDMDESDILLYMRFLLLTSSFYLFLPVLLSLKKSRNSSTFDQRLQWDLYCNRHIQRGTFNRRLRMSKESFDTLLTYIYHDLLVDEEMAELRGGSIIPELCLYCTIRYLAGGSYLDIVDIAGISKPSFYRIIWKTIMALVKCPQLALKFPQTPTEVQQAISGFASKSFNGAIVNCVGVVDGYLLRIRTPAKKQISNVRSCFSGHYQCYGLNVQAVADHYCRFTYFAIAAPGNANDRSAIKQCGLLDLIEALPNGICVIGDAAYEPSEHMAPIYQGNDKLNSKYDNWNFYASQLRIRVEMAFGQMNNKFGILQRPLQVKLKNVKWMAQAIARLHNFVINERMLHSSEDEELNDAIRQGRGYVPTIPHEEDGDPVDLEPLFNTNLMPSFRGYSELREAMADRVKRMRLVRPVDNRLRRAQEVEDINN
jgi:DDE superfamily endonuclease